MGVGQMAIFSRLRGGEEQPCMEEGEVQIFFLITTIISFRIRKSSVRKIKIIEPCWALIKVTN